MGPTPPGTGVMKDARCLAELYSTSPTTRFPLALVLSKDTQTQTVTQSHTHTHIDTDTDTQYTGDIVQKKCHDGPMILPNNVTSNQVDAYCHSAALYCVNNTQS